MSQKTTTVCDYPVRGTECGNEGVENVTVKIGKKTASNDYCTEQHLKTVEDALTKLGLKIATVRTADSKSRKAMKAASGATFTTAEARDWLKEQGIIKPNANGRLSKTNLQAYADAH